MSLLIPQITECAWQKMPLRGETNELKATTELPESFWYYIIADKGEEQ
jgi:hypothetical protein